MRLITEGRGQGKTTKLIYASYITGYPIVVLTQRRADDIINMSMEMNVEIENPITLDNLRTRLRGVRTNNKILIDDIDNCDIIGKALNLYLGCEVVAATCSPYIPISKFKDSKNKDCSLVVNC